MPLRWEVHAYRKCGREGGMCFNILQLAVNTCQSPNWQIVWFSATKVNLCFGLTSTEQNKQDCKKIISTPQKLTCF